MKTNRRISSACAGANIVLTVVFVIAVAVWFIHVPDAQAANVSYVGNDGNVYRVSPDGTIRQPVTTDATAEAPYVTPTQKNDGTIVAIRRVSSNAFAYFLDPQTGQVKDSWLLPKTGAGSFAPFNGGTISPDGGMFVYDWHYFDCWTNPLHPEPEGLIHQRAGHHQPLPDQLPHLLHPPTLDPGHPLRRFRRHRLPADLGPEGRQRRAERLARFQ